MASNNSNDNVKKYLYFFIFEFSLSIVIGILSLLMAFNDDIFKQYSNSSKYKWYCPYYIIKFPCDQLLIGDNDITATSNLEIKKESMDTLTAYFLIDNTGSVSKDSILGDNMKTELINYFNNDTAIKEDKILLNCINNLNRRTLLLMGAVKTFIDQNKNTSKNILVYEFTGEDTIVTITAATLQDTNMAEIVKRKLLMDIARHTVRLPKYQWSNLLTIFDHAEKILCNYEDTAKRKSILTVLSDFDHEFKNKNRQHARIPEKMVTDKFSALLKTKKINFTKFIKFDTDNPNKTGFFGELQRIGNSNNNEFTIFDVVQMDDFSMYSDKLNYMLASSFCLNMQNSSLDCYAEPVNDGKDYLKYDFMLKLPPHSAADNQSTFYVFSVLQNNKEQQKSNIRFSPDSSNEKTFELGGNQLKVYPVDSKTNTLKLSFVKYKSEDDNFKFRIYYLQNDSKMEMTLIPWIKLKKEFAVMWLIGISVFLNTLLVMPGFYLYDRGCFSKRKKHLGPSLKLAGIIISLILVIISNSQVVSLLKNHNLWYSFIWYISFNALNLFLLVVFYRGFTKRKNEREFTARILALNYSLKTV